MLKVPVLKEKEEHAVSLYSTCDISNPVEIRRPRAKEVV